MDINLYIFLLYYFMYFVQLNLFVYMDVRYKLIDILMQFYYKLVEHHLYHYQHINMDISYRHHMIWQIYQIYLLIILIYIMILYVMEVIIYNYVDNYIKYKQYNSLFYYYFLLILIQIYKNVNLFIVWINYIIFNQLDQIIYQIILLNFDLLLYSYVYYKFVLNYEMYLIIIFFIINSDLLIQIFYLLKVEHV